MSTNIINYSVTKYIPLTIISIVNNLSPIIVCVLAFLILKEQIRAFDILMMLLTLGGIFGTIFTAEPDPDGTEQPFCPLYVLYILLLANPFLSAGGQVAMRKMSKFNDCVVSWYLQWSVMSSSAIVMLATGESFSIYAYFDW